MWTAQKPTIHSLLIKKKKGGIKSRTSNIRLISCWVKIPKITCRPDRYMHFFRGHPVNRQIPAKNISGMK